MVHDLPHFSQSLPRHITKRTLILAQQYNVTLRMRGQALNERQAKAGKYPELQSWGHEMRLPTRLQALFLFVGDQPTTIGALPVAVAQAYGVAVGYPPGLAVRRIADLHPGEAKTDARGAAIIAQNSTTGSPL